MSIGKSAHGSRDRRGADAGQIADTAAKPTLHMPCDLGFSSWGGQDLNLRPTDYEFDSSISVTAAPPTKERLTRPSCP